VTGLCLIPEALITISSIVRSPADWACVIMGTARSEATTIATNVPFKYIIMPSKSYGI
jgi:hypothetical protein